MKVVVLSDTHIRKQDQKLPTRLIEEIKSTDLIIHAGDWNIPEVYEKLKRHAETIGVYGNVDGEDIKDIVPEKQVIEVEGWRIGVVHGHGDKKTTEKRAVEAFEEPLDIIIFGHSHLPLIRYIGKTMLFNPGSATDKRKLPYYSFGILHLEKELKAEHIFYANKK